MQVQKQENLSVVFRFMKVDEKIELVNIGKNLSSQNVMISTLLYIIPDIIYHNCQTATHTYTHIYTYLLSMYNNC